MNQTLNLAQFYDPHSYLNRQLILSADRFSTYGSLPLFAGTFNVGDKKFPGDPSLLHPWLKPSKLADQQAVTVPLIYAIGFQEVDMSSMALMVSETGRAKPWVDAVATILGDQYVLHHKQMMGLLLVIGLHRNIMCPPANAAVEGFKVCGVGLWNKGGNKGGIAGTVRLYDTRILFCNLHLSANRTPSGPTKRNRDIYNVFSRITMLTPNTDNRGPTLFETYQCTSKTGIEVLDKYITVDEFGFPGVNAAYNLNECLASSPFDSNLHQGFPPLLRGHDIVFVLGDLNYRLHTFTVKPHVIMDAYLANPDTERSMFLKIDQLSMQLRKLQEPAYQPTYSRGAGKDAAASETDDGNAYMGGSDEVETEASLTEDREDDSDADSDISSTSTNKDTAYYEDYTNHPFEPCSYLYGFREHSITFNPTYKILTAEKAKQKGKGRKGTAADATKKKPKVDVPFQPVQLTPDGSTNLFDILDSVSVGSTPDTAQSTSTKISMGCVSTGSTPSQQSFTPGIGIDGTCVSRYEVDPEAGKPRTPAYCDRILFRPIAPNMNVVPVEYTSVPVVEFSDHHPVYFLGNVNIRMLKLEQLEAERKRICDHLPIFTKELQPRYTLLTKTLNIGRVAYGIDTLHPITIRNDHPITSLNIVLDPSITPPWVVLKPVCFTLQPMTTNEIALHHRFRFLLDISTSNQLQYISRFIETLSKPDNMSLESLESKRAFVLRQIIEGKVSVQTFTVGLSFLVGRGSVHTTQSDVLVTEKIQCTADYTGLRDAICAKALRDLVIRGSTLVPPHLLAVANYFEAFLTDAEATSGEVDVFNASRCSFKVRKADDVLLHIYNTLKASNVAIDSPDMAVRFAATSVPCIFDEAVVSAVRPLLAPYAIPVTNQPAGAFAFITDDREKEELYILFYHLATKGLESLKTVAQQLELVTSLGAMVDTLRREFLSFKYYCLRSLFTSPGPRESSNTIYTYINAGQYQGPIPQSVHPASVAETIADFVFSLPEGIFPEYSYFLIKSFMASGLPSEFELLQSQMINIFTSTLSQDSSNLFLFIVALFRYLLHHKKTAQHGFHLKLALQILAKLTFRSSERTGRDREDEVCMLAFLKERQH